MTPVDADPAALVCGIAVKRTASGGDGDPHGEQSKRAAATSQVGQDAGQQVQKAVFSDEGKQPGAEDDHGDGSAPALRAAKKMKRDEGLPVDIINKELRDNDCLAIIPLAGAGGGDVPPSLRLRRRRLLEIKKRGVEIEEQRLALERRRLRWVEACGKGDTELEKMRLENGRLRVENERLWMRLFRRGELELGAGVKSEREQGRRDGAAEMERETKPLA
ncbi:uncharacterized protein LOC107304014 [Oryza brachyantha]|uniref:Uncharacterized protein n=1 Tax=Oryza brachyantha TaxID=4533 RepID=J3LXU4_ORYBR|nr:uncharacterized protein LOC107304014 [Oryza brachyantha]